jgi:predicted metal-dependent hydrolase
MGASLEKIFEKVRKRAPWIQRQKRFFSQFQPRTPERKYVSGETHLYLGRQYKLKIVPDVQQQVKLHRRRLIVQSLKPEQRDATKTLVEQWYHERAQAKFRERLALCQQRFSKPEDFEPAGLVIMRLRQRWGSMTPTGKLILNWILIRASVEAIDYVITHELCHMRHNAHGGPFFDLLDRVMPDWERRRLKLECQLA